MSERNGVHPFSYATHPRSLDTALRDGALSRDEFSILVALYARANRATWTISITLDRLAEIVAWDKSSNWLGKLLRGLRDGHWIDYSSRRGGPRHVYRVRLLWARTESDITPSYSGESSPSSEEAEDGAAPQVAAHATASESEFATGEKSESSPSSSASSPSFEKGASPPSGAGFATARATGSPSP